MNVAARPRPVLLGAAKTRQAAFVVCAARAFEQVRGLRSAWVRNCLPGYRFHLCTDLAPTLPREQSPPSHASSNPYGPTIAALAPGPAAPPDQLRLSLRPLHCLFPNQLALPVPGGSVLYHYSTFLSDQGRARPLWAPPLQLPD